MGFTEPYSFNLANRLIEKFDEEKVDPEWKIVHSLFIYLMGLKERRSVSRFFENIQVTIYYDLLECIFSFKFIDG